MTDDTTLDRRVERTRSLLYNALLELIMEKPYNKITVQEIIDRANVGRSTFYSHFTDKDDLLRSGMNHLRFDIREGFSEETGNNVLISVRHIFEHVAANYRPYRALMSNTGLQGMRRAGDESISKAFVEHLEHARQHANLEFPAPPVILAQFLSGALHSLIFWWLQEQMPYTPAEMDEMFGKIISGMVRDIVAQNERST